MQPWKKCQSNSIDRLGLPKKIGYLSISVQLRDRWGTNCFGNGTQQYWGCVYQSWSLHIFFVCHNILFILSRTFLFLESVFSIIGNCCISTTVTASSSGELFGIVSTTWKSPNFHFNLRKTFLLCPMFQLILTRKDRKMMESKQLDLLFIRHYNGVY